MSRKIPVSVAERVGKENQFYEVVIVGRDDTVPNGDIYHIITWGKNKRHCRQAKITADYWRQITGLVTERDRMRKALQEIAERGCGCTPVCRCNEPSEAIVEELLERIEIARNALAQSEGERAE